MNEFNEYAAASENNTALHRRTSARELNELYPFVCVPVSGDMLAVIKRGTFAAAKRRRRAVFNSRMWQS